MIRNCWQPLANAGDLSNNWRTSREQLAKKIQKIKKKKLNQKIPTQIPYCTGTRKGILLTGGLKSDSFSVDPSDEKSVQPKP